MANNRKYFLKTIDSNAFFELSDTTKLLYYALAAKADDNGIIHDVVSIIKKNKVQFEDFCILEQKRYIFTFGIPFEPLHGLTVITVIYLEAIRNDAEEPIKRLYEMRSRFI